MFNAFDHMIHQSLIHILRTAGRRVSAPEKKDKRGDHRFETIISQQPRHGKGRDINHSRRISSPTPCMGGGGYFIEGMDSIVTSFVAEDQPFDFRRSQCPPDFERVRCVISASKNTWGSEQTAIVGMNVFSISIILDQNETLLLRNNYDFFARKITITYRKLHYVDPRNCVIGKFLRWIFFNLHYTSRRHQNEHYLWPDFRSPLY